MSIFKESMLAWYMAVEMCLLTSIFSKVIKNEGSQNFDYTRRAKESSSVRR